jgi:hypothetical protein
MLKTVEIKNPLTVEEQLPIKLTQVKSRMRKHLSQPKPRPKRRP